MEEAKPQPQPQPRPPCFRSPELYSTWLVLISLVFYLPHTIASDGLALLAFKSLITEDPTGVLHSWNNSLHFCEWQGVTCSAKQHPQRVTALNLDSLSIAGIISPYISNLTLLTTLHLQNNRIHGRIPHEIGNLSRLQHLNLSVNFLEGEIPPTLSHCTNLRNISLRDNMIQGEIPPGLSLCLELEIISLANNKLIGEIPTQLGTLPKISLLFLSNNNLTGSIPPTLANLSSLKSLSLSVNSLSGGIPRSLGKLSSLTLFDLSYNKLSGIIPSSFYNLSGLLVLDVSSNGLVGTLPSNLGHSLFRLQRLSMYGNQFNGDIPASLANASGLESIQLQWNHFQGTIPRNLGTLSKLFWLSLFNNQIEARQASDWSFLSDLANCSSLIVLNLDSNRLGGMLPSSVVNLSTSIQWLFLGENNISGTIPAGIGNLVELTILDLGLNLLTGPIPVTIGELHQLGVLDLSKNELTGEIPSSIGNLTRMNQLYLAFNGLRGKIPAKLGNCRHLELLDLSYNQLTGTIPKEVVTISSLSSYLSLDNNLLVGPLPHEVGSLKNLNTLSISNNRLSGKIPSTLGECLIMENLWMRGNFFYGAIPLSLSKLKGLQVLDLSDNNLSGYIPRFLEGFHFLEYLNLSVNNLEGEVPLNGIFRNITAVSVLGNTKLCGGFTGLHLPPCFIRNSGKKNMVLTVIVTTLLLSIALCLSSVLCVIANRRQMQKSEMIPISTASSKEPQVEVSYLDLVKATDGFSSFSLIGVGNFGSVYKGIMDFGNKRVVAVKVLNLQQRGATKSFTAECEALKNIRHRNLVRILTSCSTLDLEGNAFKALVYEFMPNGSLENWLHPIADKTHQVRKLNLIQRLSTAIDVASALEYLHYHAPMRMVHCDLKPSNVLLDHDMTAHVGDFGLARFISQNPASSATLRGSIGYIAPEYGVGSQASTKGDVYSYGILILEMFTGKRPTDSTFNESMDLHKFVETAFPEQLMRIIDPGLFLQEEEQDAANSIQNIEDIRIQECLASVIRIGLMCSKKRPRERMEMDNVAKEMRSLRDIFLGFSIQGSRQSKV